MFKETFDVKKAIQVRVPQPQQDLQGELARANETLATLRLELRTVVTKYRLWRAQVRCGRSAEATGVVLFNMPMMKKIRGLWATYRFAQMVRADIVHMMVLEAETRERLAELESVTHFGFKPELVTYEELEARFGPAAAQQLYDDMLVATARDVTKRKLLS